MFLFYYLFVLICLLSKSKFLIPVNSILIKCRPIRPKINGRIKLIDTGKNDVTFIEKKAFKKTSNALIKIKKDPV